MFKQLQAILKNKDHILNLNRRNVALIAEENDRRIYPLVDNKLKTKALMQELNIATPRLIASLATHREIKAFQDKVAGETQFVIKPAQGSGGGGILLVTDRTSRGYRRPNGQLMPMDEVEYHLQNIINGLYSLSGNEDQVLVEALIRPLELIKGLPNKGVPDVRILLYRGIPTAAMLRLPTFESDGKANLHLGGVGVGVAIGNGNTTAATHYNRAVEQHPEYDVSLIGHTIPDWPKLLRIACQMAEALPLGYMGVDLVLDEENGPVVLEANARPGISIQLANQFGLRPRLLQVARDWPKGGPLASVEARLRYVEETF